MNIRSKTIAITPSLDKWLRWVAAVEGKTAESIAEQILRDELLLKYPNLQKVQDAYEVENVKLWNEAADKLKEGK